MDSNDRALELGLTIKRSRVPLPVGTRLRNDSGKVVRIHVPLSSSSIIWHTGENCGINRHSPISLISQGVGWCLSECYKKEISASWALVA